MVGGRAPAKAMLAAAERMMERLRLPVNARKTCCIRVPEESLEFFMYRVGRNYRRDTDREYIGTRPRAGSAAAHGARAAS